MSFEQIVARQAGVVAVRQAGACGLSSATMQRRVRDGRWRRLHPGVHLVGGHRLGPEARVWAAWLWAGDRAAVSGPSAAYLHGQ
ncbi:MAG: type IV toxin-antitoxin system AbiEi family antitoxin domain-containing protein, partial [Pseudonocardia sp.]